VEADFPAFEEMRVTPSFSSSTPKGTLHPNLLPPFQSTIFAQQSSLKKGSSFLSSSRHERKRQSHRVLWREEFIKGTVNCLAFFFFPYEHPSFSEKNF